MSESEETREDEVRERLFSRSKHRRPDADLLILNERGTRGPVEIPDEDTGDWVESTIKKRFRFKEKEE